MPESAAVLVRGTPVSPGMARGRLVLLEEGSRGAERAQGSTEDEAKRLQGALAAANAELGAMLDDAMDSDAGMLLAFQVEMLSDPVVTQPAYDAIAAGAHSDKAWRDAMELQVREYRESD